jgi:hypothetical protein
MKSASAKTRTGRSDARGRRNGTNGLLGAFRLPMASRHPARAALLVALLGAGVAFWDWPIVYPLKLLSVMGHETGHAVASLLVGGKVDRISLRADESGQCLSRIPDGFFARAAVYSAGYVGSTIIAVVLLVATFRFNARRWMLGLASAWLGAMGLLYARDSFTLGFCVVMAALFAAGARWLPQSAVGGVNLFVAAFTALYSVMDLKDDLWNRAVRAHSDAQLLADVSPVPAVIWAGLWTLFGGAILLAGVWIAMKEPQPAPRGASRRSRS